MMTIVVIFFIGKLRNSYVTQSLRNAIRIYNYIFISLNREYACNRSAFLLNVESTSTDSYLAANVCRLATCLYLLASVLVYHSYRLSTLIGLWHFLDFNIAVSVCNLHHIKFHKLKRHFLYLCLMLSGRNCFSYDNKQRNTSRICTFWWHWGKDEIIILRFNFM